MKSSRSTMIAALCALGLPLFAAGTRASAAEPPVAATPTVSPEAEYLNKLNARVAPIVASLGVDGGKATRLQALIVAQYREVNAWHEEHDSRLKDLARIVAGPDAEKGADAKREIAEIRATMRPLHDRFIAALASELDAGQIEKVKDGMTAGKVQFTYKGYVQQIPTLTEEQKAKVLEFLKAAREEAIDAGSMDEKSAIFNQYKGRINNYLSKQGVDQGKGRKNGKKPAPDSSAK